MAATVTREIIEERWCCATRDVTRFKNEAGISATNSERWIQVDDGLEEIAAFLVGEVRDAAPGSRDVAEIDDLHSTIEDIWTEIHDRLTAWAEALEADREERRKAAAA